MFYYSLHKHDLGVRILQFHRFEFKSFPCEFCILSFLGIRDQYRDFCWSLWSQMEQNMRIKRKRSIPFSFPCFPLISMISCSRSNNHELVVVDFSDDDVVLPWLERCMPLSWHLSINSPILSIAPKKTEQNSLIIPANTVESYDDLNDYFCSICLSTRSTPNNPLICCDGKCLRSFHLQCLGYDVFDPPPLWTMRTEHSRRWHVALWGLFEEQSSLFFVWSIPQLDTGPPHTMET